MILCLFSAKKGYSKRSKDFSASSHLTPAGSRPNPEGQKMKTLKPQNEPELTTWLNRMAENLNTWEKIGLSDILPQNSACLGCVN